MQTASTCQSCNGTGKSIKDRPSGSDSNGMIKEQETVKITIPAGVEDDMQLKVSGKGNAAPFEGINGDLLVLISVDEHESLARDGQNLHYDHYISFSDSTRCRRSSARCERRILGVCAATRPRLGRTTSSTIRASSDRGEAGSSRSIFATVAARRKVRRASDPAQRVERRAHSRTCQLTPLVWMPQVSSVT